MPDSLEWSIVNRSFTPGIRMEVLLDLKRLLELLKPSTEVRSLLLVSVSVVNSTSTPLGLVSRVEIGYGSEDSGPLTL